MDVTITRHTAVAADDDDAIRTELLGIIEKPLTDNAELDTHHTAVDTTGTLGVRQLYRVGGIMRVYRPSGPTPAQALKSIGMVILDTCTVTPNNQVRLIGKRHPADAIHHDLARVIDEIRGMQEPDVPDEYRALAEAACASQPTHQTEEEIRAWARRLGASIAED